MNLYSDKVDVSEIAKQYEFHGKRGGGHTGAAGFECDYPPFLEYPRGTPVLLYDRDGTVSIGWER